MSKCLLVAIYAKVDKIIRHKSLCKYYKEKFIRQKGIDTICLNRHYKKIQSRTRVFERNPLNSSCSPCVSSNTDLNNYVYSQENMHESVMTFVATGEFSVESVHITNFMQKYI